MKNNIKKTLITITTTLSAILIVTTATYAIGTLTPSGTAGDDTQYSLNDIYDKLADFSDTPTATSSPFSVPGSVSATFATLSDIYGLLEDEEADLVAGNIKEGVEIFGVEGTLEEATTLEWSANLGLMSWSTASTTCAALTTGGATPGDWRLPTITELIAAVSDDEILGVENTFENITTNYWSSTTNLENNSWWNNGVYNYVINIDLGNANVRCVR